MWGGGGAGGAGRRVDLVRAAWDATAARGGAADAGREACAEALGWAVRGGGVVEVACPRELFGAGGSGEGASGASSSGSDGEGGEAPPPGWAGMGRGRAGDEGAGERERAVRRYQPMSRGELRRCLDVLAPLTPTLRVLRLPEHNLAPGQLRALLDAFPVLEVLEAGLLCPAPKRVAMPQGGVLPHGVDRGDALNPSLMLDVHGAPRRHWARLPSQQDGLEGIEAALAEPRLRLHSIVLRHSRLGDAPRQRALALVRAVARRLADPGEPLRVLDLHDCRLWDGACEAVALAACRSSHLAVLKLGRNMVGLDAAAALALAAKHCASLQALLLYATGIAPPEVEAVREAFGDRTHYLGGDDDEDPEASDAELDLVN